MTIISIGQTKAYWYLAPILPWFALLFAYTFFELVLNYFQFSSQPDLIKKGIVGFAILCFLLPSFISVINQLNKHEPKSQADQYSFFVHSFMGKIDNYYISNNGYPSISFYAKKAKNNGNEIIPIPVNKAKIGKRILVCTDKDWTQIESQFIYNIIQKQYDCALIEILKRK